jgi:putative oxidoreductase
MITTTALPAASGKGRLITLWILSSLVALTFLAAGGAKLAGMAVMIGMFDKVGLGQWFRYFTGLLEVAGAIGLLMSRYAFYAAALLAIVMVGAIIAHVAILGGSPAPAATLLVLSGIIAYLRKPYISTARDQTEEKEL